MREGEKDMAGARESERQHFDINGWNLLGLGFSFVGFVVCFNL